MSNSISEITKSTYKSNRSNKSAYELILKKLEKGTITKDEICTRCHSREKGPGLRFFCTLCYKEVSKSSSNNDGDFTYFGVKKLEPSHYRESIKSPRKKSIQNSPPKNLLANNP